MCTYTFTSCLHSIIPSLYLVEFQSHVDVSKEIRVQSTLGNSKFIYIHILPLSCEERRNTAKEVGEQQVGDHRQQTKFTQQVGDHRQQVCETKFTQQVGDHRQQVCERQVHTASW